VSSTIPLTSAVTSGDESAVSALLAGGADVNETASGGRTALILAVIFGHTHIVQQLIQAGADPQQRDNLGLNAIDWAKRRGLTEALDILTNKPRASSAPKRILIKIEEPQAREETPTPSDDSEAREQVSDAEKSRRWIAGFKQRLDEQALRRLNRNEPVEIKIAQPPEPEEPLLVEPKEPEKLETPQPSVSLVPAPSAKPVHSSRILTPAPTTSTSAGKRKRCPKCNAVYNGELVSYCAIDMAPLVDADAPIKSAPPRPNPPLFWIMVIITLTGSIVVGSLITAYLFKSNQAKARVAAEQQATVKKGSPELSTELVGKSVFLPEAECPVKGPEPVSGTVAVRIMVDKNGQVYWARGSGGDWLMRGAATEAAMKSTFSPDKLRGRETEGTITYTFKP
jgi:hypothetical protein